MNTELFTKITTVCDRLLEQGVKLTINEVIVSSLFFAGGTLAGKDEEIKQVIEGYTKNTYSFVETYRNGKTENFKLKLNNHGVLCLGFKVGLKMFWQCAMDRYPVQSLEYVTILKKIGFGNDYIRECVLDREINYQTKALTKI